MQDENAIGIGEVKSSLCLALAARHQLADDAAVGSGNTRRATPLGKLLRCSGGRAHVCARPGGRLTASPAATMGTRTSSVLQQCVCK